MSLRIPAPLTSLLMSLSGVLFLLALAFPRWDYYSYEGLERSFVSSAGRHLVLSGPPQADGAVAEVDARRAAFEAAIFGLLLFSGAILSGTRPRERRTSRGQALPPADPRG
jgi:hypothetical protein